MRKFLLICLLTTLMSLQMPARAQHSYTPSKSSPHSSSFREVPPQLRSIVATMLELPEAKALLAQVLQEGEVSIVMQPDPSGQFDAMWDGDFRQIKVNPYRHSTAGSWICSILFELHNASTNREMLNLFSLAERNLLAKEQWVEQMERMEHKNGLNTCRLLNLGIAQGIYPPEAKWTIFYSFDDYYKLQQITDHSGWLATHYDDVNPRSQKHPFKGTIARLSHLTAQDKKELQDYLVIKNYLESPSQEEVSKGMALFKNERQHLESCFSGKKSQGCIRTRERWNLMQIAFNLN